MIWKGKELKTVGDIMHNGIEACNTREEAQEFMQKYIAEHPESAECDIGYLSGYYSPEKSEQIRDWFSVNHPVLA